MYRFIGNRDKDNTLFLLCDIDFLSHLFVGVKGYFSVCFHNSVQFQRTSKISSYKY